MQSAGYVCRSCVSSLQRQCRASLPLQIQRRLQSTKTIRHRLNEDIDLLEESYLKRPGAPQSQGPRNVTRNLFDGEGRRQRESQQSYIPAVDDAPFQNDRTDIHPEDAESLDTPGDELIESSYDIGATADHPKPKPRQPSNKRNPRPEKGRTWGQTSWGRDAELKNVVDVASDRQMARKRYSVWKRQLAYLWRAMKDGEAVKIDKSRVDLDWFLKFDTLEAMQQAWQQQPPDRRDAKWNHLMLVALRVMPEKAHLVLEAICERGPDAIFHKHAYAVSDTIHFLLQRKRLKVPGASAEELANSLGKVFVLALPHLVPGASALSQNNYFHIATHAPLKLVAEMYKALQSGGHELHHNTLLQFARVFAKDAEYKETSLSILKQLTEEGRVDINSMHGAALCTSILSMSKADANREMRISAAKIFEMLLEQGLRPNVITYTTIIRNMCLNKEVAVAWEVFDVMKKHGIEPDLHVYTTLMHGAKLSYDLDSMGRVLTLAPANVPDASMLWNDALHGVLLSYVREANLRKMKRPWALPAFQTMFPAYANLYHTEPLQVFAISDLELLLTQPANDTPEGRGWETTAKVRAMVEHLPVRHGEDLLVPSADTVGLMLIGYLSGFSRIYNVIAFYSRFRRLLKAGNPVAVWFVQEKGTLLHDIVIKAVVEWPGMLRVALDVVSDMLKDCLAAGAESSTADSAATRHPAPSVYTWNILLNGFMHQKYLQQGERILGMMREHGIAPDMVTWNTLVAGYASTQLVTKAVGAVQQLERAGHRPDEHTMRALSYLTKPDEAARLMEEAKRRQELRERGVVDDSVGGDAAGGVAGDGVEAALRDMEMVVDEVANDTDGPGLQDVEADGEGWDR